ncbi:thioredoxin-like protein [Dactylonectria macrodidyma]|uniref:Thioredoxin-like protein n=1 Tax=Dactylonectria macrodidyma TaxID=307937 RepID=A0A9P9FTB2_9HYPO|nr:thioredoxin-like protein [Dactylonectria macrodidyma]
MRIQIVFHADLLCPWSFVGKRSLETAMYRYKMQHPNIEFEVIWKPFLLYPGLQYMIESFSVDKRELYIQIMGTEKLRTFIDGVQAAGVRHGVDFSVHGATGPSQRGHRLVALALQTLGPMAQGAVVESIFRGHFEHGMDIADAKWLMSVGSGVGLEPQAVLNALDCQAMGQMLNDELTAAATTGVIAVPSVLIGARFRVAGYQAPELFEGAFDRLRKEREQGLAAMNQAMRCDRLGRGGLGMSMEDVGPNGGWTGPAQGNQAPDIQGTVPDEGDLDRHQCLPDKYQHQHQLLSGKDQHQYRLVKDLLHMEYTRSRSDKAEN